MLYLGFWFKNCQITYGALDMINGKKLIQCVHMQGFSE